MSDYTDSVDTIAEECREEYPDTNDEGRHDYIFESVDGSSHIIYDAEIVEVLRETDNEPDGVEVAAMAGPNADWRKQRQVAAFLAMEADVYQALARLDMEAEDEDT